MNTQSMPGIYDFVCRFAAALVGCARREVRRSRGDCCSCGRWLRRYAFRRCIGGVAGCVRKADCSGERGSDPSGLTTNTVTKMVVAISSGGRRFALQIIPGLILVVLGAWFGTIFSLFR